MASFKEFASPSATRKRPPLKDFNKERSPQANRKDAPAYFIKAKKNGAFPTNTPRPKTPAAINSASETAHTDLSEVAAALESDLGESQSTKLVWKPNTTTELDLEGMQKLMKLVDALEDDDDVQRVTTNFEINDEVMSQISQ